MQSAKNIPTYMHIYEDVYEKIINGDYKEGDKLPTEMEFCAQYYVSRITVKKALEKLVSKGLIIRIAGKGTFVNVKKSNRAFDPDAKIGLVMCGFGASYGSELIRSIEKEVTKRGKNLVLKNSHFNKELEAAAINELLEQQVEGIILQPTHNDYFNNAVLRLSLSRFPMVIVDRELKGVDLPYVGTDNVSAMGAAMQYLFEKGHRNICFVSGTPRNTSTIEDRLSGFRKAFADNGFPYHAFNEFLEIQSVSVKPTAELIESDIQRVMAYISAHPEVTCVFTGEYAVCALVKEALKRLGKSIPEDISLMSFDNVSDPFYFTTTTYIKQNEKEIGKKAVDVVMDCIENSVSTPHLYLSCSLVENSSVKELKA